MGLREKLAAKQRRRASYPVQVSDPAEANARVAAARLALSAALISGADVDEADREARRAEVTAAQQAAEACFVDVAFTALAPEDFEALMAAHTLPDGSVDRARFLPALAAACAVEEDLQDEEWWAGQLDRATGAWSPGEWDALYQLLFVELNYSVPSAAVSKG
ncbi:MAG: hypothetical protein ACYC1Z_03385 [Georgenia sp.]